MPRKSAKIPPVPFKASKLPKAKGPGSYWKNMTPEQKEAQLKKAAETRRRNAGIPLPVENDDDTPKDVNLGYIALLESLALGTLRVDASVRPIMVSVAATGLRKALG